jgi:hypothetical protein
MTTHQLRRSGILQAGGPYPAVTNLGVPHFSRFLREVGATNPDNALTEPRHVMRANLHLQDSPVVYAYQSPFS